MYSHFARRRCRGRQWIETCVSADWVAMSPIAVFWYEVTSSMKYPVALIRTEKGYSVSCPGLPGCWSQGKTEEEALANIKDAIQEYLDAVVKISRGSKVCEVEVPA